MEIILVVVFLASIVLTWGANWLRVRKGQREVRRFIGFDRISRHADVSESDLAISVAERDTYTSAAGRGYGWRIHVLFDDRNSETRFSLGPYRVDSQRTGPELEEEIAADITRVKALHTST